MENYMQQNSTGDRQPGKRSAGRVIAVVLVVVVCGLFGAGMGFVAQNPQMVYQFAHQFIPGASSSSADAPASDSASAIEASDKIVDESSLPVDPTRQIAAYGKLKIFSPIAQENLTGVLFHQASYNTALVITTKLPDADLEKVSIDHPVRVNNKQTKGKWVDADALHLYRTQDATAMDTAIDVGAKAGTTVYAPVTGTVVKVQEYQLYGYVPDVKIQIQPEGHPELDVVLLHQYDPLVKPGDKVEGGVTPISSVRDIAKDLTDVQLGFFTAPDDPGNHSHVEVNDASSKEYRERALKGAYKVK